MFWKRWVVAGWLLSFVVGCGDSPESERELPGKSLESFELISEENREALAGTEILFGSQMRAVEDVPGHALLLHQVTELSEREAAALADSEAMAIVLPDLEELTPEVASQLARWPTPEGEVSMEPGWQDFGRPGQAGSRMLLLGMPTLAPPAAEKLIPWGRGKSDWRFLGLEGLEELSVETAEVLVGWAARDPGWRMLHFSTLPALDPEVAEVLISWGEGVGYARTLFLTGLESLTPALAEVLARWGDSIEAERRLMLRGLRSLSLEAARHLVEWTPPEGGERDLMLTGLESVERETLRLLVEWERAEPGTRRVGLEGDVLRDAQEMHRTLDRDEQRR